MTLYLHPRRRWRHHRFRIIIAFWRHHVAQVDLNSQTSPCFSLLDPGVADAYHQAWFMLADLNLELYAC